MQADMMVNIRPLEAEEINLVSSFVIQILEDCEFLTQAARLAEQSAYAPANIRAVLQQPNTEFLIAERDNQLIGFLHAQIHAGTAWVRWVGVDKAERRRNVAGALWAGLFESLRQRGVHKIWGSVVRQNAASLQMASCIGFEFLGNASQFWHGLDYVLVQRAL